MPQKYTVTMRRSRRIIKIEACEISIEIDEDRIKHWFDRNRISQEERFVDAYLLEEIACDIHDDDLTADWDLKSELSEPMDNADVVIAPPIDTET